MTKSAKPTLKQQLEVMTKECENLRKQNQYLLGLNDMKDEFLLEKDKKMKELAQNTFLMLGAICLMHNGDLLVKQEYMQAYFTNYDCNLDTSPEGTRITLKEVPQPIVLAKEADKE